ncbi:tudor domain-containing 6 isoform X2 [Clupea harengus]|uniref:Tudor domain-containing 6 isoform X2 n=1 Tax=Clupea harengus TaxID=7950 RepID=A0A6P3VPY7_CLUHA|nr:tudor domain-containing 6 isoform X2 [Clupea harengus]
MTNGSKGLKTAVLLSSKMESHQRRKFKEFGEREKAADKQWSNGCSNRSNCTGISFRTKYHGSKWSDHTLPKTHKDNTNTFLSEVLKPDSYYTVTVQFVKTPSEFWVQTELAMDRHEEMKMEMSEMYGSGNDLILQSPKVGTLCVVLIKCGDFYRAVVKAVLDTKVKVHFVDHGNEAIVDQQDLRILCSEHRKLPALAFKCSLSGISPIGNDWSQKAIDFFVDEASQILLDMHVSAHCQDKYTVELFYKNAGQRSINEMMCSEGLAVKDAAGDRFSPLRLDSGCSTAEASGEDSTEGDSMRSDGTYDMLRSALEMEVGSQEKVWITCVKNVHEFYGQLERHSGEIEKLNKQIEFFRGQLQGTKCSLSPGAPCFAKYCDGQWYRGHLKITKPIILVHFLDYGDIVAVNKSDILPVPYWASEIMFIRAQAVEFNLSDAPADTSSEVNRWFENYATGQHFTATLLEKYPGGKFTVELHDGKLNVNKAIREKSQRAGPNSLKVLDHSTPSQTHDLPTLRECKMSDLRASFKGNYGIKQQGNPSFQHGGREPIPGNTNVPNNRNTSANLPMSQKPDKKPSYNPRREVVSKTKPFGPPVKRATEDLVMGVIAPYTTKANPPQPQKLVSVRGIYGRSEPCPASCPKLANLPDRPIGPGVATEVYVSHVNSHSSFFVQLVEDEDKIHSLVEELNADQNQPNTVSDVDLKTLQEGDVVSALYPDDESWYRAVVMKVSDGGSILVEFIDFGNEATVVSSMVRSLKNSFLDTPRLSVHCSINVDVHDMLSNTSDEEMTVKLKGMAEGETKKITCMFVKRSGIVWEICFVDPGTTPENSLAKLTSNPPIAKDDVLETKKAASTTDVPCPSESYPEGLLNFTDLPSRPIRLGVVTEVYISHVNSLGSFFVQLVEDEDQIHSLVEELNTDQLCSQSNVNVRTLQEGDVVGALYPDDESWYRAVVKKVNDSGSILVEFIDFGNEATVMSTMVNSLKKRFLDSPRFSVHCCVGYDVNEPLNSTSEEEMTAKLNDYTRGEAKKVSCTFAKQSDHVWEVYFVESDTTLKTSLVGMSGITSETKKSCQSTPVVYSTTDMPSLSQQPAESPPKLEDLPNKTVTPGVVTEVYLSHVSSQASFFVQLVEDENKIHSLVEELNTDQPCKDTVNVITLQEGDVVGAIYPADESWNRAVVKKVNSNGTILVEFIDFGNEATIMPSLTGSLKKRFLDIPRLSIHCCVGYNVSGPLKSTFEEEITSKLKDYANGEANKVSCMFTKQSGLIWEVCCVDPDITLKSSQTEMTNAICEAKGSSQEAMLGCSPKDVPCLPKQFEDALPKLESLPDKHLRPGVVTEVYVSHVNSPGSLFVQLVEDEDQIHSLVEELNTDQPCSQSNVNVRTLQEGDVVGALYPDDESWYRAVVKKVNDGGSILVEFIDFGNEATVVSSQIRCLGKSFLQVPKLSVHCCLNDGFNVLSAEELMTTLRETTDGEVKKMNCIFIKNSDRVWEIHLDKSGTTIEPKAPKSEDSIMGLTDHSTSVVEPATASPCII